MKTLESLKWRYATKKFNPEKKASNNNIESLKEAIRLTPTSFGLQPFKVLIIENNELRQKLRPHSWNQSQITDCSHLFVFCPYVSLPENFVDEYLQLKADTQSVDIESIRAYGDYMKSYLQKQPEEFTKAWASKQTYIALGNLLTACGELRLDACPIEGFVASEYENILGLSKQGLTASVIVAVGYRADEDMNQKLAKVRRPAETIFEHISNE